MSILTFFGMLLVAIVGIALCVFAGTLLAGGVIALIDAVRNEVANKTI